MADLARDPVINAINEGIRRGIEVTVANGCYGSAVILIYSGIDSMAYLGMPAGQVDVIKKDFIDWTNRYIKFPCKEQLTGADIYGARCGMLHNYSVYSNISRSSQCRIIGYMDKAVPEVMYNPAVNKNMVLVSVPALAGAFSRGIDTFLVEVFSDKARAQAVEQRMKNLVQCLPVRHETAGS
ncbi:MAG TPA: hypothetical protein VK138_03215 [Acidiferrobacterales bacterium]|nr:hypothetical protein [Acidiferrobacterales bacterium]